MKKLFIPSIYVLIALISFSFTSKKTATSMVETKEFKETYAFIGANSKDFKNGYFILKTEVSNEDYNKFLQEISKKGDKSLLETINPKTELWASINLSAFEKFYHTNVAYNPYPVVNISYEAATAYCAWLTAKANAENTNATIQYEYRLPTQKEWTQAAMGTRKAVKFAWGGPGIMNKKGMKLCNYTSMESTEANDNSDVTAPVKAYPASSIGAYNLNGNVAEMVSEKGKAMGGSWLDTADNVTNESVMNYETASPKVGFRPILIVKAK